MRYATTAAIAAGVFAIQMTTAAAQMLAPRPLWEYVEVAPAFIAAQDSPERLVHIKSYGPSGPPPSNGNSMASDKLEFGESERGSLGCLIGGALGTSGALAVGGENIINLIAGGLVIPSSPAALYASLFGVVFASFCAVGQAMTPAIVYAYRRYFEENDSSIASNTPPAWSRELVVPGFYHRNDYDPPALDPVHYGH